MQRQAPRGKLDVRPYPGAQSACKRSVHSIHVPDQRSVPAHWRNAARIYCRCFDPPRPWQSKRARVKEQTQRPHALAGEYQIKGEHRINTSQPGQTVPSGSVWASLSWATSLYLSSCNPARSALNRSGTAPRPWLSPSARRAEMRGRPVRQHHCQRLGRCPDCICYLYICTGCRDDSSGPFTNAHRCMSIQPIGRSQPESRRQRSTRRGRSRCPGRA